MSYYKYLINIVSVFVAIEANVLLCLLIFTKNGLINFSGGGKLSPSVLIRLKQLFSLYED